MALCISNEDKRIRNELWIKILKNYNIAKIEDYNEFGDQTIKYCSIAKLIEVISNNSGFETPVLPDKCVFYKNIGNREIVCQLIPAHKRDIKYITNDDEILTFKEVPLPPLLFTTIIGPIQSGNAVINTVNKVYVHALKTNFLDKDNTILYKFPLSNVYNDERICFGTNNNKLNYYSSVSQLSDIPYLFLSGYFNTDLSSGRVAKKITTRALLKKLSEKEMFPYKILVKKVNFKHFIESIL